VILQSHCFNDHCVDEMIYDQYFFTVSNSAYCHLLLRWAYAEKWLRRTMKFKNVKKIILENSDHVLQNFTIKKFVQEDALIFIIDLKHIILMHICCFDHVFFKKKISHHSAWTDYWFDIMKKKIMKEEEMRLWVDITIKICEEITVCWSEKFDSEWQTIWTLLEASWKHEWMRIAVITDEISEI